MVRPKERTGRLAKLKIICKYGPIPATNLRRGFGGFIFGFF